MKAIEQLIKSGVHEDPRSGILDHENQGDLRPCYFFDLIIGTSTGG